jgi:hypothetical protein
MSLVGFEKRSETREPFYSPVEFVLKSEPERTIRGIGTNISRSGLGIFSYAPLNEGQEMIVRSTLPVPQFAYTVSWSKMIIEDFFTVGLRVIE